MFNPDQTAGVPNQSINRPMHTNWSDPNVQAGADSLGGMSDVAGGAGAGFAMGGPWGAAAGAGMGILKMLANAEAAKKAQEYDREKFAVSQEIAKRDRIRQAEMQQIENSTIGEQGQISALARMTNALRGTL